MQTDLIQRILDGDRDAFAHIVREYQSMLTAYVAFRVPDRALVDEIVQLTFIRAYEQLADFEAGKDFGIWLRTLCKYITMAELKRQVEERRHAGRYKEYVRLRLLQSAFESCQLHAGAEETPDLKHCLQQLQPRARQLVELRYLQQMTIEEVAAACNQTAQWAATTLFRLRATLRKCLESRFPAESAR